MKLLQCKSMRKYRTKNNWQHFEKCSLLFNCKMLPLFWCRAVCFYFSLSSDFNVYHLNKQVCTLIISGLVSERMRMHLWSSLIIQITHLLNRMLFYLLLSFFCSRLCSHWKFTGFAFGQMPPPHQQQQKRIVLS